MSFSSPRPSRRSAIGGLRARVADVKRTNKPRVGYLAVWTHDIYPFVNCGWIKQIHKNKSITLYSDMVVRSYFLVLPPATGAVYKQTVEDLRRMRFQAKQDFDQQWYTTAQYALLKASNVK